MLGADRGPLRVVGRYALYNEIAAGGMATVHIGRLLGPVGFARTVAVKRLHPQFAKDPEFVSMFLDEARLAARVQHPNVVATIDVVAADGELFLIMDYVRGESLSKLLRTVRKQGARVPPRVAASIMCGFLHGLHAAHEAKNERGDRIDLVHRDVSPQNVLVGSDGIPRVLDFGIAKAAGRIQVTRDGQIKGKLAYMPPEQLSGRELTRAADIYASAVVMWETLTGERLFKGESESETLAKILRDPVIPPSVVVPGLGTVFDAPLLRALSRDASKRHATARELAFELEKCVGVASASEVGEWVEAIVGASLSARENQIVAIESNSAGIRVSPSGRPDPESSDSHSSFGVPSSRAGTLLGVGSPNGAAPGQQSAARQGGAAHGATDTSGSGASSSSSAADDSTGSKITGSRTAETTSLPIDRNLPMLATAGGLIVLLIIVGVVIAGSPKTNAMREAGTTDAATTGATTTLGPAGAAPGTATTGAGAGSIPDPAPATATPSAEPALPPDVNPAASVSVAPPHATPVAAPHVTQRPTSTVTPSAAAPPKITPPPQTRRSCDPPYTLDVNGRKKYKLECM